MTRQPHDQDPGRRTRDPQQVLAQLRGLATGEDWAGWLAIAARFPGWDFTTIMLIAAQRPDATDLAGYEEWQARGRHVRRGERAIRVIDALSTQPLADSRPQAGHGGAPRPSRPPGSPRPAQDAGAERVRHLWDISQTNGSRVPERAGPLPTVGPASSTWEALSWVARREGFAVEQTMPTGSSPGETDWAHRRIQVSAALDAPGQVRALLHELGHVLAHGDVAAPAGETTAGCHGVRKVEADSAAFIVATRLGVDTSLYAWPRVATWAGSDARARPEEAVRAVGDRVTRAADLITAHLDAVVAGGFGGYPAAVRAQEREPARGGPGEEEIRRALGEAERFYQRYLSGSWAEGYVARRGLRVALTAPWGAGYAPGGWTALTTYLRQAGFTDAVIEAAGLARRSVRGNLIDRFRGRAVLPVRDERGRVAGFIGRARPGVPAHVPKYLNSPQTPVYRKGELLFGLAEGREALERGAVPVIVEGPFDAIAVTMAGKGWYVGVAPCGTALTATQVEELASIVDLNQAGVLVALDGDRAGRAGTVRAYQVLTDWTQKLSAANLPAGRDPADILERDGAAALAEVLGRTEPLARVVIDAHLDEWADRLTYPEGQLAAMRSAARFITATLPEAAAAKISRPARSALTEVARLLPAGMTCQIVRVAERTSAAPH